MRLCIACDARFDTGWTCPSCGHTPDVSDGIPALISTAQAPIAGFQESAFEDLWRVEEGSFWFRSRRRLLLWALEAYFPTAESFFEIGCGTGFVLAGLEEARPGLRLGGSDPFSAALAFAGERLDRTDLVRVDARRLPFDAEWDVIGAFDVLEHVDDDETVLREMFRAVRPGGGAILTVPQHAWLWSPADVYAGHERRYARTDLLHKVRRAGFRLERVTSFMSLLLPAMMVSRMTQRLSGRRFDPMSEFACSPSLDRAFERIANVEIRLLRRGVSFPVGGSLLLVAMRD